MSCVNLWVLRTWTEHPMTYFWDRTAYLTAVQTDSHKWPTVRTLHVTNMYH